MSEVAVAEPAVEAEPPRALGSGATLDREQLRRRRCGPGPGRACSRPRSRAARRRAQLAAAAAGLGIATLGELLLHVPHAYRDRSEAARSRSCGSASEATVVVEVRSARLRPTRRRRPGDRRGQRGRRERAVEGGLVQPGLACRAAASRERGCCSRQARPSRRFRVEAHEILTDQAPDSASGLHTTGLVPVHPASERCARTGCASGHGRRSRRRAGARAAAGGAARPPPAAGRRRRAAGAHFPADGEQAALRARAAGVRGAASAPGRARDPAPRASRARGRASPGRARRGRLARRWLDVAALRAHGRSAARDRRDRRRPRLGPPHAAAADGRGRVGEDGLRPVRDASRGRGGLPGGADGADRDPRRAARRDARPAARIASRSAFACSPARRRRRAGARRLAGSRAASSGWSSGRTR